MTKQAKQVVVKESVQVSDRTPQLIAAEIRSIDAQARKIVMDSAIEIGKRLIEAKELVAHGEWGKWLELNVNYSQSSANNFMRIATEYEGTNSQTFGNLSYSQAVALLAVPAEEREVFIEETNASELSSRELKAAIEARQEAERKLQEEQERAESERKAREELEAKQKEQEEQVASLQAEIEKAVSAKDTPTAAKLRTELKEAKQNADNYRAKIKELQEELKKKPIDIPTIERVEVIPEETQKELEALRKREQELAAKLREGEEATAKELAVLQEQLAKNNNTVRIKVQERLNLLVSNFNELLTAIAEEQNEEEAKKFKGAVMKLCDKIKGQL